jgi:hypothetical protein
MGKEGRRVKKILHIYINAKVIPVETILGIWGLGETNEAGRRG